MLTLKGVAGAAFDKGVMKLEQKAWQELGRRQEGFFNAAARHYVSAPAYSHASEESFMAGIGTPSGGKPMKTGKKKPPDTWSSSFASKLTSAKTLVKNGSAKVEKIWFGINSQAAEQGVWDGGKIWRYQTSKLENLLRKIESAGWARK